MVEQRTVATSADSEGTEDALQLRMHPRVFASLGKDLVTNDVVAVMELVKNSYDAFAHNVWVALDEDDTHGPFLEIRDDGFGMTRDVIENVWCMVATPYRESHHIVRKGKKKRRVVGAKGLGRLSVARLGNNLTMLTQAPHSPCWEVTVDWMDIASKDEMSESNVSCKEYSGESPFTESGTKLQIFGLTEEWDQDRIDDLRENLARLLSPFSETKDFNIFLTSADSHGDEEVRIESPEFLSNPKYSFQGKVDALGNVKGTYRFSPIGKAGTPRTMPLRISWYSIRESVPPTQRSRFSEKASACGPFSFEIRAWDIAPDDTQEISDRFEIQKSIVRKAIRAHKGISVYRDGVLVLPKSENARDWLGLDLRRVGRVGPRLSTSQLVGYVAITADKNPGIVDTSDRERLSSSLEVAAFEEILMAIVKGLEEERKEDRIPPSRETPMADLFSRISAQELLARVKDVAATKGKAADTVRIVQDFADDLDQTRRTIEDRFVYYSRLATVGTIAQRLIHEIRNRTTAIGSFLRIVKRSLGMFPEENTLTKLQRASDSVNALENLADTFAPLANRNFTRRNQQLVLEDRILGCLQMNEPELREKEIKYDVPNTRTLVTADPGELDTIILNLIMNASFWLGEVPREARRIEFSLSPFAAAAGARVDVSIHDSGPGIDEDDLERVFLPGVTRKLDGIGMGLNVASELVAVYGGEMRTMRRPTPLGGASFAFDLPRAANEEVKQC